MSFSPSIWSAATLPVFLSTFCLFDCLNRDYDPLAGSNASVFIPVLGKANGFDGKNTPTPKGSVAGGFVEIKLDQETGSSVPVKDMDAAQTSVPLMRSYGEQISNQVKNELMTKNIITEMIASTNTVNKVKYSDLVSGANGLSYDLILRARQRLNDAGMPDSDRYMLVDSEGEISVMKIKDDEGNIIFASRDYMNFGTGSSPMADGIIGRILGFQVVRVSDLAKVTAAGDWTNNPVNDIKRCTIFFQKSAMAGVVQKALSFTTYPDSETRSNLLVGSVYWGRKVVRDKGILITREG